MRGTELSIHSVCTELRLDGTRYKLTHWKKSPVSSELQGRKVLNLSLYRVCTELSSACTEYKLNVVQRTLSISLTEFDIVFENEPNKPPLKLLKEQCSKKYVYKVKGVIFKFLNIFFLPNCQGILLSAHTEYARNGHIASTILAQSKKQKSK